MNDLVFGGWDIYEDTAYEAAANAKVLEQALLEQLKEPLSAIRPMKAVFDHEYVRRINGPNVKTRARKMDKAEMLMDDIAQFRKTNDCVAPGDDLVRLDRSFPSPRGGSSDAQGFRVRPDEERSGDRAQPDLRVRRAQDRAFRSPTALPT